VIRLFVSKSFQIESRINRHILEKNGSDNNLLSEDYMTQDGCIEDKNGLHKKLPDRDKLLTKEACEAVLEFAQKEEATSDTDDRHAEATPADTDNDEEAESSDEDMEDVSDSSSIGSAKSSQTLGSQSVDCDSVDTDTASIAEEENEDDANQSADAVQISTGATHPTNDIPTVVTTTQTQTDASHIMAVPSNNAWRRH